ncbi:MAG TPA: hypothetical protein VGC07_08925 [Granulicella sp.]
MALDIQAIRTLPPTELSFELQRGGRLVVFQYCVSILVMSFRRNSSVQLIKAGESATSRHLPYSLLSFFLGWWGIPWGFIYTPQVLYRNFNGGVDVTGAVIQALQRMPAAPPPSPAVRR